MIAMIRPAFVFICLVSSGCVGISGQTASSYPHFDYDIARAHEIKPHRRSVHLKGVGAGFNQLHLTLTVSPEGDVLDAHAGGDDKTLKFWPQLEDEVRSWKFAPFEENGNAVTAEIEEYIDLVPPERFPKKHVSAPIVRSNSKVTIALDRTGCYGTCPSYTVNVSTNGIVFEGGSYVVATGRHTGTVSAKAVRRLAKEFAVADFYSMDTSYRAGVTDCPTYGLSISIDGHKKELEDYMGSWVGMPEVITELEEKVDTFARTDRWIEGTEGLVQALQREKFEVKTYEAQVMLKEAATRGQTATVQELLKAGVPLKPLPAPKPKEPYQVAPFENVGWLNAASGHFETLKALMDADASENDQDDKDLALAGASRSGNLESVRALIAYGANPNANLSKQMVRESTANMAFTHSGPGSILIYAAESGNPEVISEILQYQPNLNARDMEGKTALFAAAESGSEGTDDARVECVRLLVQAGADVNARDNEGNTALHETFLTDVEEELLKLGANVNARNNDGETPIFTTVDDDAIPLFIKYGADLSIRNNKSQTVVEAARDRGPLRQEALRKAIEQLNKR